MLLDRTRFRFGLTSKIDYRNYEQPHAYNRGDHSIIIATKQRARKILPNPNLLPVNWGNIAQAKPTKTDKLLICGSGYFFPTATGELPKRIANDLKEIKESGAELHLLGTGFNYLLRWPALKLNPDAKNTLQEYLKLSTTITVRDHNTKQFLQDFTPKDIRIIGDPALFIAAPSHEIQARKKDTAIKISVNIPFHGPGSTEWIKKNLFDFIGTLKAIRTRVQCEFFYFVHYNSEILVAALIADSGVPITVIDCATAELPSEYAKMDLHIGGMLHSCILATAAGTPSIALAYDKKHFGFFALMESSDYCINASHFHGKELQAKVFALLNNIQEQRTKIKIRREELALDFEKTILNIAGSE